MMTISVIDANSQAIEAVLDDQTYYIILDWNDTGQYWEMGIRNYAYQTLVDGICVAPNFPLLKQFKYVDLPPGDIQCVNVNDIDGPPSRDDFTSGNFQMIYMEYVDLLNAV
jgi:hypothetical protein